MTPDFNVLHLSSTTFEATMNLLRAEIGAADLMVLHEIDTQTIVRKSGLEIPPLRQILYFHPRYMKRVLEGNAAAVIEAPLKFTVRETVEGAVHCHFIRPEYLFGRYNGLEDLGAELKGIVEKIAKNVS